MEIEFSSFPPILADTRTPYIVIIFFKILYEGSHFEELYTCFAGNETFEKLGTIGTSSNLLVYFTTVFNMSSISATNLLNIFNGSANFGTLLGAFFSDTYFGRYKTLGFACVASFLVLYDLHSFLYKFERLKSYFNHILYSHYVIQTLHLCFFLCC